ncbi:MAG: hypothetical protein EOO01_28525 [Chitinophagaceae bacterium]|nr:MAG: hypothetical protein EOO01_28525 [Chitinophagaceae bacterium]
MKKIIVILLCLIYGFTTMGATIHLHYCMNEFVGWDLVHGHKDKECDKCGMKEDKSGCCKDEHKQVKLKTEHQKGSLTSFTPIFHDPGFIPSLADFIPASPIISLSFPVPHAPPPVTPKRILILNCVFLI